MEPKSVKTTGQVSKQMKAESKLNKFIVANINEAIVIARIEKFLKRYLLAVSCDMDQYMAGDQNKSRMVWVTLVKFVLFVVGTKFAISGLSRNLWIRAVTCDSNYLIGHPIMISVMMSICAFTILFIGLTLQYQEANGTLTVFKLLHSIKHKSLANQLHGLRYRRLIIYSNLMTKYLLLQGFWSLVIVTNGFMFGATLLAYNDPKSGFSTIGVVFWSVLTLIWTIQFYGNVLVLFIIWFMVTFCVKNQFFENNDKIKRALRTNNQLFLIRLINDHHKAEKMTVELNQFFRLLIFVLYYCATPALEILIYLSHDPTTYFYARFAIIFIFVMVFGVVFLVNYMSAQISKAAKKSCPALYTHLSRMSSTLSTRWKLVNFIETLSGNEIGFCCYDMFPMNNYEFYQYLYITGLNYFLILDLKSRLD